MILVVIGIFWGVLYNIDGVRVLFLEILVLIVWGVVWLLGLEKVVRRFEG